MFLDGRIVCNINRWNTFLLDSIMGIDEIFATIYIAIPSNISSPQYWSNNRLRSLALIVALAVGQDLSTLCLVNNKGLVASGKYSSINLNIPVLERLSDRLYLPLDTLLNGR